MFFCGQFFCCWTCTVQRASRSDKSFALKSLRTRLFSRGQKILLLNGHFCFTQFSSFCLRCAQVHHACELLHHCSKVTQYLCPPVVLFLRSLQKCETVTSPPKPNSSTFLGSTVTVNHHHVFFDPNPQSLPATRTPAWSSYKKNHGRQIMILLFGGRLFSLFTRPPIFDLPHGARTYLASVNSWSVGRSDGWMERSLLTSTKP
jgi:hypothetical protein